MAPHSSTLAWNIPWMEELVGCSPLGHQESDVTERLHFHFSLSCIGEGNGNPLQCSCLENPRDGEAWWAVISGVAQSDMTEATQQQQQQSNLTLTQTYHNDFNYLIGTSLTHITVCFLTSVLSLLSYRVLHRLGAGRIITQTVKGA